MDAHLDMEELTREISQRRATELMYQAICTGEPVAMIKLQQEGSVNSSSFSMSKCTRENALKRQSALLGTRQVESLLRFMVSREVQYQMEDAESDHKIYDSLGSHRILGKKKKKTRLISYP